MSNTPQIDDREPSLADRIAAALEKPAIARMIAEAVFEDLRADLGGRKLYVHAKSPKTAAERQRLVQQIKAECNGRNIKELCQRYGMSRAAVYRALNSEPAQKSPADGARSTPGGTPLG